MTVIRMRTSESSPQWLFWVMTRTYIGVPAVLRRVQDSLSMPGVREPGDKCAKRTTTTIRTICNI